MLTLPGLLVGLPPLREMSNVVVEITIAFLVDDKKSTDSSSNLDA